LLAGLEVQHVSFVPSPTLYGPDDPLQEFALLRDPLQDLAVALQVSADRGPTSRHVQRVAAVRRREAPRATDPDCRCTCSSTLGSEEARISVGERERVWVGVGAYKNPVNETLRQIEAARERGVGGVVVFAYDSASSTPAQPSSPPPLQQISRGAFSP